MNLLRIFTHRQNDMHTQYYFMRHTRALNPTPKFASFVELAPNLCAVPSFSSRVFIFNCRRATSLSALAVTCSPS